MIHIIKKILTNNNNFLYKYFLSPISNNIDTKNYNFTLSYPLRYKDSTFPKFKYAIYFDNEDPAAILQVDKWFSQGFFTKNNTLVLFRIYSSSVKKHINFLENNNYHFYAYRVLKNLDLSKSNIKFMFYPFNSFTNPVLIKNRSIKHIWIAHGESDKLASVNPMIRMYDFIFAAGDISIERFLHYKIINSLDIEKKVIKVGIPYLNAPNLKLPQRNNMKILYAPTWEGVEINQQYSSLEDNFGLNIINKLNTIYPKTSLYYMPHPSTGIKISSYIEDTKNIILKNKYQKDFHLIQNKNSFIYPYLADIIKPQNHISTAVDLQQYDLVITDISSILANLIFYKVNYLVLVKQQVEKYHLNNNSDMKKDMPLLSLSTIIYENQIDSLKDKITLELTSKKDLKYNKLISVQPQNNHEQSIDYYIKIMEKL